MGGTSPCSTILTPKKKKKSKYLQYVSSGHDRIRMCHQKDPSMPEHVGKRSPAKDARTNI